MSKREYVKGQDPINILGDITVRASTNNIGNYVVISEQNYHNSSTPQDDTDKENNVDNNVESQHSANMYFSDEEPVFSDSEEEREYNIHVLETVDLSDLTNKQPKKIDAKVQCDLTSYEMDILELVKKCASYNFEDVNEEFRELIQLCRHLNYKYQYGTPPLSGDKKNTSISSENRIEIPLQNLTQQTPQLQNRASISAFDFLPSRQGSKDFSTEKLRVGDSKLNITGIVKLSSPNSPSTDNNNETRENKVKTLRRSSRFRKQPARFNKSGIGKSKNRVQKAKKKKNNRNLQHDKGKPLRNQLTTQSSMNNKKRARKKDVDDIVLDYILRTKLNKNRLSPISSYYKDAMEDVAVDFRTKISLPAKQVKSLARNWMKPKKNRSYRVSDCPKFKNTRLKKLRRLYSPTEWLQSKEFGHLCEKV